MENELTKTELMLLKWLAKEEFSQYGECHGVALNGLVDKGLAEIHEDGEHQESFIAKGRSEMYRAVSLTDKGRVIAAGTPRLSDR
jgi:hypothetical protein